MQQFSEARPSTNFDPAAHEYDAARSFDPELLGTLFGELRSKGHLPAEGTILDVGCGTGQLTIPLAKLGYAVTGIDISTQMLAVARAKTPPHLEISYRECDVQEICYPDAHFDATVANRLFMHIGNWRLACREILRVTKPGHALVMIDGGGFINNTVHQRCRQIAQGLGYNNLFSGVETQESVLEYLLAKGCTYHAPSRNELFFQKNTLTYGEVFSQIRDRAFARYWQISSADHQEMLAKLANWIDTQPRGMDTEETIADFIGVHVFIVPTQAHTLAGRVVQSSAPAQLQPVEALPTALQDWLKQSIPVRFQQVATHFPQQPALKVQDRTIAYGALNRTVNQFAHALMAQRGCNPEPVAVILTDPIAAIIALLAICKAGKFSVFIDPTKPLAEAQAILADAQSDLLVTDHAHSVVAEKLVAVAGDCGLMYLDDRYTDFPETDPEVDLTPESFAQIVYTSGSTGKPKGVIKTHAMHLYAAAVHAHGTEIGQSDRMMVTAPILFGSSLSVVFAALLSGALLCPYDLKQQDEYSLADWLNKERITVYQSVPVLFRQLLDPSNASVRFPHIRIVKLGGEAVLDSDIEGFRRQFDDRCVLRVGLASSETGPYCWHFFGKETQLGGSSVPVGLPLPEKTVAILDENHRPVEIGESGEIAVSSRYLSPGYWRNPELTAKKFSAGLGDARTFLTGDRGRIGPDGLLYHQGRMDFMVKVRGYRVEPESIERALLAHPNLSEAVVVARPGRDGENRLIAYLVTRAQPTPPVPALRDLAAASLPSYMIPARFVFLDRRPRNANAKVDRAALPPPGAVRPNLGTSFNPPRNELEQRIADIWAELLELEEIGVDDDFFELGGDSITAMRMAMFVESATGASIPPGFFTSPTVANLAVHISDDGSKPASTYPAARPSVATTSTAWPRRGTSGSRLQRLVKGGPAWHGHALPYGLGIRLQRAWLATPGLSERLFERHIQVVHHWSELISGARSEDAIRKSLLSNTWVAWREQVLCTPFGTSRWVTFQGDSTLLTPHADGTGVVFILMHSALLRLFQRCVGIGGLPPVFVRGHDIVGRTELLYTAYRAAQNGGAVLMLGDGRFGRARISLPFFEGQFVFRPGPAELAVHTGARLAAVFTHMSVDGHITFEACEIPADSSLSHTSQVDAMTHAYGKLVLDRWPSTYTSQRWHHLSGMLNRTKPQETTG